MRPVVVGPPVRSGRRLSHAIEGIGRAPTLWWEADELGDPHEVGMDAAALALVCLARRRNRVVHLQGPVARSRLAAIEEFQDVWSAWGADRWDGATFVAEEVRDDVPTSSRDGILAFSGGVDACYSLVMHVTGQLGHRSLVNLRASLIQGLELGLEVTEAQQRAAASARAIVETFGVPFVEVTTNWRYAFCGTYPMDHMLGIGATLRALARPGERIVTSAGWQYGAEVMPHGGHAITDKLLGQDSHPSVPTGYGANRIDKCRVVGHHEVVREHVRVCWQPTSEGGNCGECDKCIRTKLHFIAAGVGTIPALGGLTVEDVAGIPLADDAEVRHVALVLDHEDELGPRFTRAVRERIGV